MKRLMRIPVSEGSVRAGYRRVDDRFTVETNDGPPPNPCSAERRRWWRSPEGLPPLVRLENGIVSLADIAGSNNVQRINISRRDVVEMGEELRSAWADCTPYGVVDDR